MTMPNWLRVILDFLAAWIKAEQNPPAPAPSPSPSPTPPPTPSPVPPTTVGQALIEAINAQRVANGIPKAAENIKLTSAASKHATWMASTNTLSHTGQDGTGPADRIRAEGYLWSMAGENIAYGFATPEECVTGWMNSPGHRAIMLDGDYQHLGVGHAVSQGRDYWVADFATPRAGVTACSTVAYATPLRR